MEDDGIVESTLTKLENFRDSSVWRDMIREIDIWDRMAQSGYDECRTMEDVTRIQGRREALQYILSLPDTLINAVKEQMEKDRRNQDE